MKTLVVAATAFEIKNLLKHFNLAAADYIETPTFDICITGVGMTATAFVLGHVLHTHRYKQVLNLGIAGSFKPGFKPGTVLQVGSDVLAELGAEDREQFIPIDAMGLGTSTYTAKPPLQAISPALPVVRGITVNKVHGHQPSIDSIQARLAPDVESMEGAAVIYACNQLQLPCMQVRCISNFVEPRNKANWKIELAIENLNNWAVQFLTNL